MCKNFGRLFLAAFLTVTAAGAAFPTQADVNECLMRGDTLRVEAAVVTAEARRALGTECSRASDTASGASGQRYVARICEKYLTAVTAAHKDLLTQIDQDVLVCMAAGLVPYVPPTKE